MLGVWPQGTEQSAGDTTVTPRCTACPGPEFSIVPSDGPAPCPFLFLGAGPGQTEDRTRRPYTGRAGDEWENTYLTVASLRREDVHVGNACLCWGGTTKTPSDKACMTCAATHLPQTLGRVKPEVVVLMGGALQGLADERIRLDMHHGIPRVSSLMGGKWEGWIWPMYEPALGMRKTSRMTQLLEDFRNLGKWWRGEWEPPVPQEIKKDYQLLTHPNELMAYLRLERPTCKHAADTETHGGKPWSVQFSTAPNTGRMILAERKDLLELYQFWLTETRSEMALHFAGQDLDTLARMGIVPHSYRDTGQEAFQLCSLPQGLKPLVYRLFGVTMRSWEDVVWPTSVNAVMEWMRQGVELAESGLKEVKTTEMASFSCMLCGTRRGTGKGAQDKPCKQCGSLSWRRNVKYEPQSSAVESILRHIIRFTESTREAEEPYDPWKALTRMKVEGLRNQEPEGWEWAWLEGELGEPPILGIANCELTDAVEYGCGDADWTGCVAVELERRRGDKRWEIAEEDVDQ